MDYFLLEYMHINEFFASKKRINSLNPRMPFEHSFTSCFWMQKADYSDSISSAANAYPQNQSASDLPHNLGGKESNNPSNPSSLTKLTRFSNDVTADGHPYAVEKIREDSSGTVTQRQQLPLHLTRCEFYQSFLKAQISMLWIDTTLKETANIELVWIETKYFKFCPTEILAASVISNECLVC